MGQGITEVKGQHLLTQALSSGFGGGENSWRQRTHGPASLTANTELTTEADDGGSDCSGKNVAGINKNHTWTVTPKPFFPILTFPSYLKNEEFHITYLLGGEGGEITPNYKGLKKILVVNL